MSRFWKYRHKPPKGEIHLESEGIAKIPTNEVFKITKNEVDYVAEFQKWPILTDYDETINEFEWEGIGAMFLGLTIVNMYDNRGIVVKKVDPDGAGAKFGVEPGDFFIGIGGREIPENLPDGEVAKVFHSLAMPIKLTFARIPEASANELFDWSGNGTQPKASSKAEHIMSARMKKHQSLGKFKPGDPVTFYRGSEAYHGIVHQIYGVGHSALSDVLLPASNSLVQGVPIGRLSYRDESLTAASDPLQKLNRKNSGEIKMNPASNVPSPKASPTHRTATLRGGGKPAYLRQPSNNAIIGRTNSGGSGGPSPRTGLSINSPRNGNPSPRNGEQVLTRTISGSSPRSAQAALNVKAKTPSPKFIDSFNPFGSFDEFPTSLPPSSAPAPAPNAEFNPFGSFDAPTGVPKNQNFDMFETCTEDTETASSSSFDFNKEAEQEQTPVFQSAKLSRGFSRSISNSDGLPRSPSGVGNKPEFTRTASGREFARSPSGRQFSRSPSGIVSPGKALFLNAFENPNDFPSSLPPPAHDPHSKFFVKKDDGNLQAQVAGFNPFD